MENELAASLNIKPNEIIRAIGDDDQLRGKLLARKSLTSTVIITDSGIDTELFQSIFNE